jgi:leucyl/phenylalanyl-tRNA--protein transferase
MPVSKYNVWAAQPSIVNVGEMADNLKTPPFPPAWQAREDGLLMVGGHLNEHWLLTAYRNGIFPWPVTDGRQEILAWFSPDPRAILELDDLHVSRRLARRLRGGVYRVSYDCDFAGVVRGCAAPRRSDRQTWITPTLAAAYEQLYQLGHAHSVEVWQDDLLVGGLYGLALGGFFAGESMFHVARDASKVALVHLVRHLQQQGFTLLDVQQASPHLTSMGAKEIPRKQFLARLERALAEPVCFLQ